MRTSYELHLESEINRLVVERTKLEKELQSARLDTDRICHDHICAVDALNRIKERYKNFHTNSHVDALKERIKELEVKQLETYESEKVYNIERIIDDHDKLLKETLTRQFILIHPSGEVKDSDGVVHSATDLAADTLAGLLDGKSMAICNQGGWVLFESINGEGFKQVC